MWRPKDKSKKRKYKVFIGNSKDWGALQDLFLTKYQWGLGKQLTIRDNGKQNINMLLRDAFLINVCSVYSIGLLQSICNWVTLTQVRTSPNYTFGRLSSWGRTITNWVKRRKYTGATLKSHCPSWRRHDVSFSSFLSSCWISCVSFYLLCWHCGGETSSLISSSSVVEIRHRKTRNRRCLRRERYRCRMREETWNDSVWWEDNINRW